MIGTHDHEACHRRSLRWPVCIWHAAAGRFVRAYTVELSSEGVAVAVPLSVPFSPGQAVELGFPYDLPSVALASLRGMNGRVTGVIKNESILNGEQIVSLSFDGEALQFS